MARIVGDDQGHMTNLGDNRVGLIGVALLKASRVKMDVSHNFSSTSSAALPECSQAPTVDLHDAGIQSTRIHIIVKDEFFDSPRSAYGAKQECSTLSPFT